MLETLLSQLNVKDILSVFTSLFIVIDIIGAIPIVLGLKEKGQKIDPFFTVILSAVLLIAFLFLGEWLLGLLRVDIKSFAAAGAIILFLLAVEMIFGIEFFKDDSPGGSSALVPLVFPLIAGAASFTTLLTFSASVYSGNIIIAVILNLIVVYIVLKHIEKVQKLVGKGGVYVMRKFFGVILLAIAVRIFTENISHLLDLIRAESLS